MKLSPHEMEMFVNRGFLKVKHVSVQVVPQGLRTAFDTNTTLSGTATSEHCAIGCYAVGLPHKMYLSNHAYKVTSDAPMIPTGISNPSLDDIFEKYYGDITWSHVFRST